MQGTQEQGIRLSFYSRERLDTPGRLPASQDTITSYDVVVRDTTVNSPGPLIVPLSRNPEPAKRRPTRVGEMETVKHSADEDMYGAADSGDERSQNALISRNT